MTKRPYARIRHWYWMDGDVKTPGIGFFHGPKLFAHYTIDEARAAADLIHDLLDQIQTNLNAQESETKP